MKFYTEYVELLRKQNLLDGTLTKALKIWTCSGICHIFDVLKPITILEIGRCTGHSTGLFRFLAPSALIDSIDPKPHAHANKVMKFMDQWAGDRAGEHPGTRFFNMTSDEFFAKHSGDRGIRYDFALIDGDHSYKQVAKDWENVKKVMQPNGVVVFDNVDIKVGCPFNDIKGMDRHQPFQIPFRRNPPDGGQYGVVFMGERPVSLPDKLVELQDKVNELRAALKSLLPKRRQPRNALESIQAYEPKNVRQARSILGEEAT